MAAIYKQIKELEKRLELLDLIKDASKTEGGRLTEYGQNFVHICLESESMSKAEIARILEVTPSAISQLASKINK